MSVFSNSGKIIKIMDNSGHTIMDVSGGGNGNTSEIISDLPLVFQSDGNNLADYTICGNIGGVGDYDNTTAKYKIPVTIKGLNLFNGTLEQGSLDDGVAVTHSTYVRTSKIAIEDNRIAYNLFSQNYSVYMIAFFNGETFIGNKILQNSSGTSSQENATHMIMVLNKSDNSNVTPEEVLQNTTLMITDGTIVPDTYEPYLNQTVNLFADSALTPSMRLKKSDTNTNIPTTNGTNILAVGTNVQPKKVIVKGNVTYIKSGITTNYTVNYYSQDGNTLLYTEVVEEGDNAHGLSTNPTKQSDSQFDYSFCGWSDTINSTSATSDVLNSITADTSVYAAFTENVRYYTVYFYNGAELLDSVSVAYGNDASYSNAPPIKTETNQYTYSFLGWNGNSGASTSDSNALKNITSDRNVYAIFSETEKTFSVTFYNGNTVIDTVSGVNYNGTATYSGTTPTKTSTAQYDYTFVGWTQTQDGTIPDENALTGVTANRSVYAVFSQTARTYTVSFYNEESLLNTVNVVYGDNAVYSSTTPTKPSTSQYNYTFLGWNTDSTAVTADSNALNNITADRTLYAIFTQSERTFTVYFYNESVLLQTITNVAYGGSATYSGTEPTKTDYQFTGWSPLPSNITADTSCYAQFEQVQQGIIDSWDTISQRSIAGTAANYYSVGDCKAVELNGTMGTLALNETLYVYILGFNHNSAIEGNGITFGGFKTAATDGIDVALVDSSYLTNKTDGSKIFNMSHWGNSNYGGWSGSDLRYDILGSTNQAPTGYGSTPTTSKSGKSPTSTCATSPVSNTLMSCLPSDLRVVMKPMTKYTDNTGNQSNTSSTVTVTTDYLPLLSEFEVLGTRSKANQYEQNKQAQYAYFVAGNSKVKYKHNDTSSSCLWWLRSPSCVNARDFCSVHHTGGAYASYASYSLGVAPAFLI